MKHTDPAWQWLDAIEVLAIDGTHEQRTGAVETLLVVLSGTFDLIAGGGSWPARGVRGAPREGKPVALFLPPNTPFQLTGGPGEILLAGGRQPEVQEEAGEATSKKPLLAMAGSGKAFDPKTGEWKNQEMFPSSPQALLPRHIESMTQDGAEIRDVFPYHYKALALALAEVVLQPGATFTVPPFAGDYPDDVALWFDAPDGVLVDGVEHRGRGYASTTATGHVQAGAGEAFVTVVFAGDKS